MLIENEILKRENFSRGRIKKGPTVHHVILISSPCVEYEVPFIAVLFIILFLNEQNKNAFHADSSLTYSVNNMLMSPRFVRC